MSGAYEVEICSGASKRLGLEDIEFRHVPADHAEDEREDGGQTAASWSRAVFAVRGA